MPYTPRVKSLSKLVQPLCVDLDSGDVAADDSGGRFAAFLARGGRAAVVLIVPAIGLNTLGQWLAARGWRALSYVIIAGVLIVSGAWTVRDYSRYAVDAETAYAFEDAGVQLAQQARSDLQAGYRVYVAERFARDWTSVPFLIGGAYTSIPDGSVRSDRYDATGDVVSVAV